MANYEIYYQPGRHFLYSNAGYYLLAATMEEFLGYPLSEFVYENLFRPLEIKDRTWDKYGPYLAGATKLYLSADDMLKIGKLIINKGRFNGKQIISSSYVEEMLKPKFKNPNESKREYLSEDYYGLGIWISEAGVIFASGTGGQLIVILHDRDTIIITTNTGADSKSYKIKSDVDNIIKSIYTGRN